MNNVEILGRSNLQPLKSRKAEWNKLEVNENKKIKSMASENKILNEDLVYERDEFNFSLVL